MDLIHLSQMLPHFQEDLLDQLTLSDLSKLSRTCNFWRQVIAERAQRKKSLRAMLVTQGVSSCTNLLDEKNEPSTQLGLLEFGAHDFGVVPDDEDEHTILLSARVQGKEGYLDVTTGHLNQSKFTEKASGWTCIRVLDTFDRQDYYILLVSGETLQVMAIMVYHKSDYSFYQGLTVPIEEDELCAWADVKENGPDDLFFLTIYHPSDVHHTNHLALSTVQVCKDGEVDLRLLSDFYFASPLPGEQFMISEANLGQGFITFTANNSQYAVAIFEDGHSTVQEVTPKFPCPAALPNLMLAGDPGQDGLVHMRDLKAKDPKNFQLQPPCHSLPSANVAPTNHSHILLTAREQVELETGHVVLLRLCETQKTAEFWLLNSKKKEPFVPYVKLDMGNYCVDQLVLEEGLLAFGNGEWPPAGLIDYRPCKSTLNNKEPHWPVVFGKFNLLDCSMVEITQLEDTQCQEEGQ